jgi:hypothetical protein
MVCLHVVPDATRAKIDMLPDNENDVIDLAAGSFTIAGIPDGTASGAPAVALVFPLPDGHVAVAQTTLALFLTATDALRARHGDPRNDDTSEPDHE